MAMRVPLMTGLPVSTFGSAITRSCQEGDSPMVLPVYHRARTMYPRRLAIVSRPPAERRFCTCGVNINSAAVPAGGETKTEGSQRRHLTERARVEHSRITRPAPSHTRDTAG